MGTWLPRRALDATMMVASIGFTPQKVHLPQDPERGSSMPYRTHLTTPPGETPVTENVDGHELYTPGLAVPTEPKVPMRFRGPLIVVGLLVLLVLAAWVGFQLVTAGQDFDPSLDVPGQDEQEFDPTIPIPGEG